MPNGGRPFFRVIPSLVISPLWSFSRVFSSAVSSAAVHVATSFAALSSTWSFRWTLFSAIVLESSVLIPNFLRLPVTHARQFFPTPPSFVPPPFSTKVRLFSSWASIHCPVVRFVQGEHNCPSPGDGYFDALASRPLKSFTQEGTIFVGLRNCRVHRGSVCFGCYALVLVVF